METTSSKVSLDNNRYKWGAKACLVLLFLYIVIQLIDVFRTKYQLESPLLPKSLIWEINKQFIFNAAVATGAGVIGLFLYFTRNFLFVIILVIVTLIAERYIYI